MPKIESIEYFRVRPRWLFVKLADVEGKIGWGEATLEGHTLAVEGALEQIKTRIVGLEANNIEHIWQLLYRLSFYRGGPVLMSALSGIDIALWDLKARRLNVPLYELLGGLVRHKCQVYCWIGGDRPGDVEAAAKARKAQGLTAVKMNATEDVGWLDSPRVLDACLDRVRAVKAVGLDVAVDFHGRLHKAMSQQLASLLAPLQPLFIEEPLLPENPSALASLRTHTATPIALGERLHTRWALHPYLTPASHPGPLCDILQPDIAHVGGISEFRRMAAMAEAHDVAVAPHCPLGPIAFAACLACCLALPNFAILEMSLGIHYHDVEASDGGAASDDGARDTAANDGRASREGGTAAIGKIDLLTYLLNPDVFAIQPGGYVHKPVGPGLGIEIDEDLVRRVARDTRPWNSGEFYGPDGAVREW